VRLEDPGNRGVDLIWVRHVTRQYERRNTATLEISLGGLQPLLATRRNRDMRSCLTKACRDLEAEATRPASDERHLSGKREQLLYTHGQAIIGAAPTLAGPGRNDAIVVTGIDR